MKVAKKLFAVIVVLAMIAGLSSVAFAAGSYNFDLKAEKDGSDYVKVTLIAKKAEGFKSGSVTLKYDPSVVEYDSTEYGRDALEVNNKVKAEENTFVGQPNGKTEGEVIYGFYFLETLWSAKQFADASKRGVTADVDTDTFEAAVFYFKVIDKEAASATFSITGSGDVAPATVSDTVKLAKAAPVDPDEPTEEDPTEEDTTEEDPTEEDPTEEDPTEEDPTEEKPSKKDDDKDPTKKDGDDKDPTKKDNDNPSKKDDSKDTTKDSGNTSVDVGPNTGDSGALAIAAGVCALAAAAFGATKKRK